MPRALTIAHSKVAPPEREALLERLRARHASYVLAGCHYWAFENPMSPGEFTEFAEARDDATLAAAHKRVHDPLPGATHIYHEVDLS
ncbi:MAG: hypothetical protein HY275_06670 [Gemmatimonadetes bacterium]|nr:hypothetical protein [Gemmatimonadota bacterium]